MGEPSSMASWVHLHPACKDAPVVQRERVTGSTSQPPTSAECSERPTPPTSAERFTRDLPFTEDARQFTGEGPGAPRDCDADPHSDGGPGAPRDCDADPDSEEGPEARRDCDGNPDSDHEESTQNVLLSILSMGERLVPMEMDDGRAEGAGQSHALQVPEQQTNSPFGSPRFGPLGDGEDFLSMGMLRGAETLAKAILILWKNDVLIHNLK